jgi:methylated-DNA-[protein]-cysteine S-methyltransferase
MTSKALRPVVLIDAPSSSGPVHIAVSERGVVAAELLSTPETFAAGLERRGLHGSRASARGGLPLDRLARRARDLVLRALDGAPVDLAAVEIDLDDRPAWDRLVLAAVRTIPRGETASYGEVAGRIGRPGAARAVGGAVGRNPVGLFVPCHRVIAGDGSLGGYGAAAWGGVAAALELKRALLRLEGVEVAERVSAG